MIPENRVRAPKTPKKIIIMKTTTNFYIDHLILVLIALIIIIPIALLLIAVGLAVTPFLLTFNTIQKLKENQALKTAIKQHEKQIYFLYADYNDFDFSTYFEENHSNVELINANNQYQQSMLSKHLISQSGKNKYPRLIQIKNGQLVIKQHFSTFKHFIKREKDNATFFSILGKSINNLNYAK